MIQNFQTNWVAIGAFAILIATAWPHDGVAALLYDELSPLSAEEDPNGVAHAATLDTRSVPGRFSGSLYTEVLRDDKTNPLGGVTFIYQLRLDSGSPQVDEFSIMRFPNKFLPVDAGYLASSEGVAPGSVVRDQAEEAIRFRFFSTPSDSNSGN